MALRLTAEVEQVTRRMGRKVRDLRKLLGLSQAALAQLAGASQGAMSRVESGLCYATPLATYVRVAMALTHELLPLQEATTVEARGLIDLMRVTAPLTAEGPFTVFSEPSLERLLRAYWRLTPGDRMAFVAVALPMAQALEERVRGRTEV